MYYLTTEFSFTHKNTKINYKRGKCLQIKYDLTSTGLPIEKYHNHKRIL